MLHGMGPSCRTLRCIPASARTTTHDRNVLESLHSQHVCHLNLLTQGENHVDESLRKPFGALIKWVNDGRLDDSRTNGERKG